MLVFHIGLAWNALTLAQGQENMTPAAALNAVGTGEGAASARAHLPLWVRQKQVGHRCQTTAQPEC